MAEARPAWRLFLSLPVPPAVRGALAECQADLRRILPARAVRWADPAQLHLTLCFLGDVDSARVPELIGGIEPLVRDRAPLAVQAEGFGAFPHLQRPRVLWVGLAEPSGALECLWRQLQAAVAPFMQAPGEERFVAHLTLGRVKAVGVREAASLRELAPSLARRRFGGWNADHLALMRSTLMPQGAAHECLHRFAFSGG